MVGDAHPRRGYSDQIVALRLAADIAALTRDHRQQPSATQWIEADSGREFYIPIEDRLEAGIVDERCDALQPAASRSFARRSGYAGVDPHVADTT